MKNIRRKRHDFVIFLSSKSHMLAKFFAKFKLLEDSGSGFLHKLGLVDRKLFEAPQ